MITIKQLLLLVCCCISAGSYAQEAVTDTTAPAACASGCCCGNTYQAPLGVMTTHIHKKGEWMASYTYMDMMMNGNRTGTRKTSNEDINRDYLMAPDKMSMQMHMAMLMYGVTDRLTLMGMGGYSANKMTMTMAQFMTMNMPGMGGSTADHMTSKAAGFADTKIYALYDAARKNNWHIVATLGVNLPTGSIKATDKNMFGISYRLPYNMQPGSGTYALLPSVAYLVDKDKLSWGAQAGAYANISTNQQGYRQGNSYSATSWASWRFFPFMSASVRGEWTVTGHMKGYDGRIYMDVNSDPSADTRNYGGQRASAYAGLNFMIPQLPALHILCEYGRPVYEKLNGLQMSEQGNLMVGAQYGF